MEETRNIEFIEAFGRKVRDVKKANGLTQEDLAEKAGMEVRQFERGEINTTMNTVSRLADALEVHPTELFSFSV